jgi:alkanesulfonate monooxygenase SsuD/methylene tetrahydromethanopterin reductase-like flavin-dependent oxidoreductase (luciferase family)
VEFGIFVQNYVPNDRRALDRDAEHTAIMGDLRVIEAADRAGFKYALLPEHHFLDEYSHLSANDVVAGYLARATSRIHLVAAIFNPLPQVNHPA